MGTKLQPRERNGQWGRVERDETEAALDDGLLDDTELMRTAISRGRWAADRLGKKDPAYEAGDHAQEVALAILLNRQNRAAAIRDGVEVPYMNEKAFMQTVANNLVADQICPRGEDRQGMVKLRAKQAAAEAALGRALSSKELETMAEAVRMEFPPGRRPRIGFNNPTRVTSLDEYLTPDEGRSPWRGGLADDARIVGHVKSGGQFSPGSAGDELIQLKETKAAHYRTLQSGVWDAIRGDAPEVAADSFGEGVAAKARAVVKRGGGVNTIVDRYQNGDLNSDSPEVKAVMRPFVKQSNTEDIAIARDKMKKHAADYRSVEKELEAAKKSGNRVLAANANNKMTVHKRSFDKWKRAEAEAGLKTDRTCDEVMKVLASYKDYSENIWSGALIRATRSRKAKEGQQ